MGAFIVYWIYWILAKTKVFNLLLGAAVYYLLLLATCSIVACCVLCAVFSLWLPETAGESLESITALFEAKLGKRSVSGARQAAVVPATPTSGTQWRELVERDGKV